MVMASPICIGIAGGTGSGKTSLAREICDALGAAAGLLVMDWYYRDQASLSSEERMQTNYDHPEALDWVLLREHVDQLLAGETVQAPVYDFSTHTRSKEILCLAPHPVLIIEGILALADAPLRDKMALKVFVDYPEEQRLMRRLHRDQAERGRSRESVLKQYEEQVRPMHQRWVEPSRQHADLLVWGEGDAGRIEVLREMDRLKKVADASH